MTDRVDAAVIGAGVVGLAVARALAVAGREVILIEASNTIGTEVSSRNSEVIHAGIYYPSHSGKAVHCVRGRRRLYAYCKRHGVGHARLGKLIVATADAQRGTLDAIARQAAANGVEDLRRLESADIARMEPALEAVAGIYSPSTGIVDSHGLMLALQGEAEDHGALIAFGSRVTGGAASADRSDGIELHVEDGSGAVAKLRAAIVVNSAGLDAQSVARAIGGVPRKTIPPLHYARGCYFTMSGRSPFSHLVYPVPEPGGLGVHVTLDLAGQCRFGPDVEWIASRDYSVDPDRADRFYPVIRRYWPGLPDRALTPGYAGIRPKVAGPGEPAGDFMLAGPARHGVAGLVHLFGIESPGLTAALSLADQVCTELGVVPREP